jgi:hypothetical protein
MQKPHRLLLDRVSSYAEEAGAFLRRRRHRARPFVRVWRADGVIDAPAVESPEARAMFIAAAGLLAAERRPPSADRAAG